MVADVTSIVELAAEEVDSEPMVVAVVVILDVHTTSDVAVESVLT